MIRGVDAQVMTVRATDFSKDPSLALKRTELNNEFLAKVVDAEKERELSGVKYLEKSDSDIAIKEKEQEKKEFYRHDRQEKKGSKQKKEKAGLSEADLSVGISERKILDVEV